MTSAGCVFETPIRVISDELRPARAAAASMRSHTRAMLSRRMFELGVGAEDMGWLRVSGTAVKPLQHTMRSRLISRRDRFAAGGTLGLHWCQRGNHSRQTHRDRGYRRQ